MKLACHSQPQASSTVLQQTSVPGMLLEARLGTGQCSRWVPHCDLCCCLSCPAMGPRNIQPCLSMERFLYLFLSMHLFLFWLCWVFAAGLRLSLVELSRSYSSLQCAGFSCCGTRALGSQAAEVVAHGPWSTLAFFSCSSWAQQLPRAGSREWTQQSWCQA